jgi:hypothetical protein
MVHFYKFDKRFHFLKEDELIFKKSNRFSFLALLPYVFLASCQESIVDQEVDSKKLKNILLSKKMILDLS